MILLFIFMFSVSLPPLSLALSACFKDTNYRGAHCLSRSHRWARVGTCPTLPRPWWVLGFAEIQRVLRVVSGCCGVIVGWVNGVSRLCNEPVLFNQYAMFCTVWKMRLSAADCVYIWLGFWELRPTDPNRDSAPILHWGQSPQTLCAHPNSKLWLGYWRRVNWPSTQRALTSAERQHNRIAMNVFAMQISYAALIWVHWVLFR